jgi:SH3 domain-binding glutamic acid-rich protein
MLTQSLGLKEEYDPDIDGKVLAAQPIGVPGAAMPLQMQGHKPSFAPTGPTPMRNSDEEVDAGEVLPGYGFQGLKVTMDELASLAKELGLGDKEATDLAKGLGSSGSKNAKEDNVDPGDFTAKEEVKETPNVTEEVIPKEEKVEGAPESKPEASDTADTPTKEGESNKEDEKEETKSVETAVVPSEVTS